MNTYIKSTLLFAAVIIFIFSISSSNVLADPTVEQVTIDSTETLPLSTITFNATVLSNEPIKEVWLLVQECRDDMCFVHSFNISMVKTTNNTYQAQCTLMQEEATQIKYHLKITTSETGYISNTTVIPLVVETKNNTTQNPSTPGFEISLLVLSIVLIIAFDLW
ncbi:MAG TPA: hypothetical protein VMY59_01670 [Candidatus Thermoplasmatota archaeon]|nr:hypothetical protein [Candidatus Thermoplasmatota archaeon]